MPRARLTDLRQFRPGRIAFRFKFDQLFIPFHLRFVTINISFYGTDCFYTGAAKRNCKLKSTTRMRRSVSELEHKPPVQAQSSNDGQVPHLTAHPTTPEMRMSRSCPRTTAPSE